MSSGGTVALITETGGCRGREAGLEGRGAVTGSALENLISPGLTDGEGTAAVSLWVKLFSIIGRTALTKPGRGDFGELLSRLLESEILAWLLNLSLRAFTSTLSS